MPVKYIPKSLGNIINSPLGRKRLKNRTGRMECEGCALVVENGHILDLSDMATEHDRETGHTVSIIEGPCRMGFVEQR